MRRAALLAGVLILAGCGGKTTAQKTAPATVPGTVLKTTTTATVGTKTCPPFGGGTVALSNSAPPPTTMLLTDVKVDSDTCTDRIIFSFRPAAGEQPGYTVEYRTAAQAQTEDASGKHIPIAGKAFLVVRFEPAATADLTGAKLETTYTGPRKITPADMRYVQEIAKTGDFEAVLTWAIGLSEQRPFKVTSSGSPARVTIELG